MKISGLEAIFWKLHKNMNGSYEGKSITNQPIPFLVD